MSIAGDAEIEDYHYLYRWFISSQLNSKNKVVPSSIGEGQVSISFDWCKMNGCAKECSEEICISEEYYKENEAFCKTYQKGAFFFKIAGLKNPFTRSKLKKLFDVRGKNKIMLRPNSLELIDDNDIGLSQEQKEELKQIIEDSKSCKVHIGIVQVRPLREGDLKVEKDEEEENTNPAHALVSVADDEMTEMDMLETIADNIMLLEIA
ncbi:hypothetical protein Dip518_001498 [Parelusimicrobium proximum]|uniref:hypothetical protein n=1 Tax=Parelusimicrobium proximum TaxID=3228953 RepID=UPI003D1638F0